MTRLTFAALSLALASACTASIPIEELPDESARVSCGLLFDCCADGERNGFTTEDACVSMRRAEVIPSEVQASLDAGRVVYDGAAAAACLSVTACDLNELSDACRDVYRPQVQAGGACVHPFDCVDGICSDGACVGISALGEACTELCEAGSHCAADTSVCVRSPAIGEPCAEFFCAEGAFCEPDTRVCEAVRGVGESCSNSFACESFNCEGDVCRERVTVELCRP